MQEPFDFWLKLSDTEHDQVRTRAILLACLQKGNSEPFLEARTLIVASLVEVNPELLLAQWRHHPIEEIAATFIPGVKRENSREFVLATFVALYPAEMSIAAIPVFLLAAAAQHVCSHSLEELNERLHQFQVYINHVQTIPYI